MIIIFIMQFLHLSQFYLCFLMQNLYRKAIPIIPLLICISFDHKHFSDWYDFCFDAVFCVGILCDRQRKAYVRRIRYDTRFFQTICNRKSFCNYCHIYDALCIKPTDYFSVLHLQWLTMAKNPTPWNHDADLYFLECINLCFSFSYCKKGIWAFAQNTAIEAMFVLGTVLATEIIRSFSISVTGAESLAPIAINLCMLFSLLNPLAAYMGYYGNITGDSGLMNLYCGRIGIDSSTQTFSFLFYKAASIVCILMGIAFIALAVWQMEKQAKE